MVRLLLFKWLSDMQGWMATELTVYLQSDKLGAKKQKKKKKKCRRLPSQFLICKVLVIENISNTRWIALLQASSLQMLP